MTLSEFLLARIAEDEARRMAYWHDLECAVAYNASAECDCGSQDRLLADCEARRRIVEEAIRWERMHSEAGGYMKPGDPILLAYKAKRSVTGDILRRLAAVYSDHPDYDPSWRA